MTFNFPPPPPPPPKASSNDGGQAYASQRDGNRRGGSDRGRGRGGGSQSRGSGMHGAGGNSRGGRGGSRGGFQHHRGGGHQRGGSAASYGQQQYQQPSPTNTPSAQAYINPAFVNQSHAQVAGQSQVDPNALAQVMSYMSTPAGVQSMAAFASHMSNTGNINTQASHTLSQGQFQSAPRYSPSQQAGQKRKQGDRNNNAQGPPPAPNTPQSSKPPRAKAAVAPPVPSFGFSLPPPSASKSATQANTAAKKEQKKRKLNLGLTQNALPADPPSDTEDKDDEEDIDEEAAYAQKLQGGGFAFEHNGEQITIRTAAEVAAWIKDRRKHFPTQKRIVEKAEETARKRARELEFLRKLKGPPREGAHEDMPRVEKPPRLQKPRQESEDVRKPAKEDKEQEDLAALRKKLHESMLDKQDRVRAVDLNLGYESDSSLATDAESSVVSSSSEDSSSEEEEEEEEKEEEKEEDVLSEDEAPTSLSSKAQPPPIRVPPPAPPPPQPTPKPDGNQGTKKLCDTWQRTGRCKFSNHCKYAHPPRSQDTSRPSLYDRLVEQECVESDGRALEAIKWLGNNGILG